MSFNFQPTERTKAQNKAMERLQGTGLSTFAGQEPTWWGTPEPITGNTAAEMIASLGSVGAGQHWGKGHLWGDTTGTLALDAIHECLELSGGAFTSRAKKILKSLSAAPKHAAFYETDSRDIVAINGGGFTAFQPEETLQNLLDASGSLGLEIATMGMLDKTRFFISAKVPGLVTDTGDGDMVQGYLTAIDAIDGSLARHFGMASLRIVCLNTFMKALQELRNRVRNARAVRQKHSKHAVADVSAEIAHRVLGMQTDLDRFGTFARALKSLPLTDSASETLSLRLFAQDPTKDVSWLSVGKGENVSAQGARKAMEIEIMRDQLHALGDTAVEKNTVAGWFQATTAWLSHVGDQRLGARNADADNWLGGGSVRYQFDGGGSKWEQAATALVLDTFKDALPQELYAVAG